MIITSSDNKKIKDLKKLNDRKYRDREGMFLAEGEHLVREAFKSGVLAEIIVDEHIEIELDIATTYVTENVMSSLSSLTTPALVMGVCKKSPPVSDLGSHVLMLDSIQDPGNLGTIIRSAVAFNVDTIVLGTGSVDIYNSKVLRATQGLIFQINIIEEDLMSIIPRLKGDDYKILGTRVTGGTDVNLFTSPSKWALIMGNEGHGVDPGIEGLCDEFLYIKMNKACESLNVSIACSIIINQLDK